MTERDLPSHDIKPAGGLVRLTVWTEHGTSTKTFRTVQEARAYLPALLNKKRARKPLGREHQIASAAVPKTNEEQAPGVSLDEV